MTKPQRSIPDILPYFYSDDQYEICDNKTQALLKDLHSTAELTLLEGIARANPMRLPKKPVVLGQRVFSDADLAEYADLFYELTARWESHGVGAIRSLYYLSCRLPQHLEHEMLADGRFPPAMNENMDDLLQIYRLTAPFLPTNIHAYDWALNGAFLGNVLYQLGIVWPTENPWLRWSNGFTRSLSMVFLSGIPRK